MVSNIKRYESVIMFYRIKQFVCACVLFYPLASEGQQVFNQLYCRIAVEQQEDIVTAVGIIESVKPTRADYVLRTLKIDPGGSGTIEQSGSQLLQPGEQVVTSRVQFRLAPAGWLEFHLTVTERLTGTTCEAEEVVSPL